MKFRRCNSQTKFEPKSYKNFVQELVKIRRRKVEQTKNFLTDFTDKKCKITDTFSYEYQELQTSSMDYYVLVHRYLLLYEFVFFLSI